MNTLIEKLRDLCLVLSGTDYNLYVHCPKSEKIKRIVMGASVLFVGIFAFISMTMFISTLFQHYDTATKEVSINSWGKILSPVIGLLWAGFIIVVDITILSAKSKWAAIMRVPIAIAIGVVVALPLELTICSGFVNRQLLLENQTANNQFESEHRNNIKPYMEQIKQLQTTIDLQTKEVAKWGEIMENEAVGRVKAGRTGKAGEGPAYREAKRNYELFGQLLSDTKADLATAQSNLTSIQTTSMQQLESKKVTASLDFLSQFDMMFKIRNQEGNEHIDFLCWAITLLFIALELTPALLKLSDGFSKKKSIYEVLEAARDHITQQTIIIMTNEAMRQVNQHNSPPHSQYSPKGLMDDLGKNMP